MRSILLVSLVGGLGAGCVSTQDVQQGQEEARVAQQEVTLRLKVQVGVPFDRYDGVAVRVDGRAVQLAEQPQAEHPAPQGPEGGSDEAQRVPARLGTAEVVRRAEANLLAGVFRPIQLVDAQTGDLLAESALVWAGCADTPSRLREIEKDFSVVYIEGDPRGPWFVVPASDACRYDDPQYDQVTDS
jgi:hypothetical protein